MPEFEAVIRTSRTICFGRDMADNDTSYPTKESINGNHMNMLTYFQTTTYIRFLTTFTADGQPFQDGLSFTPIRPLYGIYTNRRTVDCKASNPVQLTNCCVPLREWKYIYLYQHLTSQPPTRNLTSLSSQCQREWREVRTICSQSRNSDDLNVRSNNPPTQYSRRHWKWIGVRITSNRVIQ